jgi:RNA polymerase sigma-70 factor (ECF subfamily)
MLAELSDETLMTRYREGDIDAFRELYTRHSRGLYRFIAWHAPVEDWAAEVAQDAWASLHKAAARYEPSAGFRTYLYQIARNRLIDMMRQQRPILASELTNDDNPDQFLATLDAHTRQAASPEAKLEASQQTAQLHAAIRSLPSEQKEALVLQQFSGMSLDEIASVTGAAVETVKSRLRYAMQKLRAELTSSAAEAQR